MKLSVNQILGAIIFVSILFAFAVGFCSGMHYQKQQPVKVDVISYVNGSVVNTQTFQYPVQIGQLTHVCDNHYYWDRNVSFYAIVVRGT